MAAAPSTAWYEQRNLRLVVAAILLVAGAVIVATSGESVAVRFLTALVTLDVCARLVLRSRPSGA